MFRPLSFNDANLSTTFNGSPPVRIPANDRLALATAVSSRCRTAFVSASHRAENACEPAKSMTAPSPRILLTAGVLAVLLVCLALSLATRDAMNQWPAFPGNTAARHRRSSPKSLVNLHPWQDAQELAALAVTAEERQYAREAERLADHEVDQAFAGALRQARMEEPHTNSPPINYTRRGRS
jgi:hypothetical protein